MRIVSIEDDENRVKKFKSEFIGHDYVNYYDAQSGIEGLKGQISVLLLDHDLGGMIMVDTADKNTGSEVVRYMQKNIIDVDNIIVHSLNEPAAQSMVSNLKNAGYANVYRIPFFSIDYSFTKE